MPGEQKIKYAERQEKIGLLKQNSVEYFPLTVLLLEFRTSFL